MRRAKKIKINHNSEFELDLAPLLAVMVKLVPVLLISSAFVQMMVIETELPQVVSEALQRQEDQQQQMANIALDVNSKEGFKIIITEKGKEIADSVPLKGGVLDLKSLHDKMVQIKKSHPEIFKLELNPDSHVPYKDIVKVIDEVRQAHDSSTKFPVYDSKQGKTVDTPYMFPEVVFANMMEG